MKKKIVGMVFVIALFNLYSFGLFSYPIKAIVTSQKDTSIFLPSGTYTTYLSSIAKVLPNYYVSPIKGEDSNPGTLQQPWKTIGKAVQMVRAGYTIYLREGIYVETVNFTTSGTASEPIKIMAYPGEKPIIDGEQTLPGIGGCLLCVRGDFTQVSGIEVRNSNYMGIYISGNFDIVDNVYVHHCQSNGVLVSDGYGSIVENSRVWRNALSNEFSQGSSWATGISAARNGVSNAIIRGNTVWENWGEGISSFEANQTTIEDNIVHDNFSTNIYISDSTNVVCQRNFVYTDPSSYVFQYGYNSGIMLGDEKYTPPSANIKILNNIAYGNLGNFWWWQGVQGGGMNNVLIANNTFVNGIGNASEGRGGVIISSGDHQNVVFINNLIQQDGDLPVIATINQPEITYSHNLWSKAPYAAASSPTDVIGNPLLAKTGNPYTPDWFQLTALSPAIDKAFSIPEIIVDYFGNPRGSIPDIGAVEYIP